MISNPWTIVHTSVRDIKEDNDGREELLKIVKENISSINQRTNFGKYTPLHWAVLQNKQMAFDILMDHGADLELLDDDERNVLHMACKQGNLEMCNKIIQRIRQSAKIDLFAFLLQKDKISFTALHHAASGVFYEICKLLLETFPCTEINEIREKKIALNKTLTRLGRPAVYYAVANHDIKTVQLFIDHGANINIMSDYYGYSLLHLACMEGKYDMAKLLVKNGACVNTTNKFGSSCLEDSIKNNDIKCVKLLLNHGAFFTQKELCIFFTILPDKEITKTVESLLSLKYQALLLACFF